MCLTDWAVTCLQTLNSTLQSLCTLYPLDTRSVAVGLHLPPEQHLYIRVSGEGGREGGGREGEREGREGGRGGREGEREGEGGREGGWER